VPASPPTPTPSDDDVLQRFSPATRGWFASAFEAATPAQLGAWTAISSGQHALVVAPTGSGKTLAAFLWALDQVASAPRPDDPRHRCRVLYVSPLKALAVDVERNLRGPLAGIRRESALLGLPEPTSPWGVRSGDTRPTSDAVSPRARPTFSSPRRSRCSSSSPRRRASRCAASPR